MSDGADEHDEDDDGLALPPGYRIDDYEIRSVLGAGGFGITYLAWDHRLQAEVALKEYLPADFATRNAAEKVSPRTRADVANFEWGLNRFLDEARMLRQIDHPNVVRVMRHFDALGTGFIVMEFVRGRTLEQLVERDGPWDEAKLWPVLSALMDALDSVHAAGLLHRDIKPSNVMLKADGRPVLIDFGAARQAANSRSRGITAIVSPGYGPIEQYSTKSEQGPYTDIYGLAGTAYFMLTGEEPVAATDRSLNDTLKPATEAARGRALPAFLRAVDAGMKVNPTVRPQSVADWRALFPRPPEAIPKPLPIKLIAAAVGGVALVVLVVAVAILLLNRPEGVTSVNFSGAQRIAAFPSTGIDPDASDALWSDATSANINGFALATTAGQGQQETAAVYLLRDADHPPTAWTGPASSRASAVAVDGDKVFAGGDNAGQAFVVSLDLIRGLAQNWLQTLGPGRVMGIAPNPSSLMFACVQAAEGQRGSHIAILNRDGASVGAYTPAETDGGQIQLHHVIAMSDGGGVAVGWVTNGQSQSFFAARFDAYGHEKWRRVIAQPGKLIRAESLALDKAGLEVVGWRRDTSSQDAFYQGLIETLDPGSGAQKGERVVRRSGSVLLRAVQPAGGGTLFVSGVAFDSFVTNQGGSWWVAQVDREARVMDQDLATSAGHHQIAESLAWNPAQGLLAFGFSALGDRSRADPTAVLYPVKTAPH